MHTTKRTLLVIDDTADNLMLMNEVLRDGYKVKGANTGARGLQIAFSDTPPDLILLDIMMPGITGLDLCLLLKHNPLTSEIPVIMLSGLDSPGEVRAAVDAGALGFIAKPFSARQIRCQIEELVAQPDTLALQTGQKDL